MGRTRKPINDSRKANNPGKLSKDELQKRAPREASENLYEVEKPAWLIDRAIDVWDSLAPLMVQQGMLTALDVPIFAAYCQAVGTAIEAETVLHEKGPYIKCTGNVMSPRPELKLRQQAWKQAEALAKALGLTPSARKTMGLVFKKPVAPDAVKSDSDKRKSWILGKR